MEWIHKYSLVQKTTSVLLFSFALFSVMLPGSAMSQSVDERKAEFRGVIKEVSPDSSRNDRRHAAFAKAYEGDTVEASLLEGLYGPTGALQNSKVPDFYLPVSVRLLQLTKGRHPDWEDDLLADLLKLPMWLTYGEDLYNYWSENHMILWTSGAFLLNEQYPELAWQLDESLDKRLTHYLNLKIQYGYYEFFSTDYYQETLSSLINLADFAQDLDIRNKAKLAAERLIEDLLLVYNDKGAYYPAAGRNYENQYTSHHPKSEFWLLTGLGGFNVGGIGAYLATSDINYDDVANTWTSVVDTTVAQGHQQSESVNKSIHGDFERHERAIFQWTSGGYFHPETAADSAYAADYYGLENHPEVKGLATAAKLTTDWLADTFSKIAATYARSSSISQSKVDIYKNKNVVLTSIDNFYPGYQGYQQWPWAATVEDVAIWTQTGDIKTDWGKNSGVSHNTHLPKVIQDGNVALISYYPNIEIRFSGANKNVTLHWPTSKFDEHQQIGQWLVARVNDSYIAVLRESSGYWFDGVDDNFPYSSADNGRQMWAVVVGNSDTHTDYVTFKEMVANASFKQSYAFNWRKMQPSHYTRVTVDGKTISNDWYR